MYRKLVFYRHCLVFRSWFLTLILFTGM